MMLAQTTIRRVSAFAHRGNICLARPGCYLGTRSTPESMTSRWLSTQPTDSGETGDDGESPPPSEPDEAPPPEEDTTVASSSVTSNAVSELKQNLRPSEVVKELDRHIVGQPDAKKAVAIAMRNRWRRRQLPEDLRKEVTPRNVLLVGPTGCGKVS